MSLISRISSFFKDAPVLPRKPAYPNGRVPAYVVCQAGESALDLAIEMSDRREAAYATFRGCTPISKFLESCGVTIVHPPASVMAGSFTTGIVWITGFNSYMASSAATTPKYPDLRMRVLVEVAERWEERSRGVKKDPSLALPEGMSWQDCALQELSERQVKYDIAARRVDPA